MKFRIWSALIAIYIIWGSTYLAIRFAVDTIPPFLMAATRFLVPGTLLYIWRRMAGDPIPTRREWRAALIIGLFLMLGGNGGVTWAEQYVPSGLAALIVGSAPLWMVLLDAIRPGGKHPRSLTVIGVLLGFAGISLLIGPTLMTGNSGKLFPLGVAALLLAAFLWSIGSLYGRSALLPASPLLSLGMQMLAGGAGLLLTGALSGDFYRLNLSLISLRSLLSLSYLIIFGSLIGFGAYTWLLRNAPTPLVATYAYINPLIAILLGYFLAEESLNIRILTAALIIISSVALINTAHIKTPKAPRMVEASVKNGS